MISRFRQSGLVWPTVCATVGLAVLFALGAWQWQRMHWKAGLISQIEERVRRAPAAFGDLGAAVLESGQDVEYLRVTLIGSFRHEYERHVYAAGPEGPGWHVFTPLVLVEDLVEVPGDGGLGRRPNAPVSIWVNRGYIPNGLKSQDQRPESLVDGQVEVTALLRRAEPAGVFIPDPDPAANIWYAPDVASMTSSLAGAGAELGLAAPGTSVASVYADAEKAGSGWPRGGTTNLALPNKHLAYALTWWGLAGTLIGVYLAFAWQRLSVAGTGGGRVPELGPDRAPRRGEPK